jgi:hypothetical protein
MTTYDPYTHAAELGVTITVDRDTCGHDGLWLPDENRINLRPGMLQIQERSVLAHELGHAVHGHRDSRPKNEMLADRFAAEKLVDREMLIGMMASDPEAYARWCLELGVTMKILRVYLGAHRLDLARGRLSLTA